MKTETFHDFNIWKWLRSVLYKEIIISSGTTCYEAITSCIPFLKTITLTTFRSFVEVTSVEMLAFECYTKLRPNFWTLWTICGPYVTWTWFHFVFVVCSFVDTHICGFRSQAAEELVGQIFRCFGNAKFLIEKGGSFSYQIICGLRYMYPLR